MAQLPPQALFHWQGIGSIMSANLVFTHGVTPSKAVLYLAEFPRAAASGGDLICTWGDKPVWRLRGCKLDYVEYENDRQIYVAYIADRRWRWTKEGGGGRISGHYNVRAGEGDNFEIVKETIRTPRQLMQLCFEAMGERGVDLTQVPNEARPEVDWDYELPAAALEHLCEKLGCRVMLGLLDNRVRVVRLGYGRTLPQDSNGAPGTLVAARSITFDPPERPDEIKAVGARIRIQLDLPLEPIAPDTNGAIVHIDKLTDKPAGGWETADMKFLNSVKDKTRRDRLKEWLFKKYRVKVPFDVPKVGEFIPKQKVQTLGRILPIEDKQVEKAYTKNLETRRVIQNVDKPVERELPAWVFGVFVDGHDRGGNVLAKVDHTISQVDVDRVKANPEAAKRENSKGFYTGSFSVDTETGIVSFSEPVYMVEGKENELKRKPANIFLRVAVSLRDAETLGWIRYERGRKNRGPRYGTMPRCELREEIGYTAIVEYTQNGTPWTVVTNEKDAAKAADYYLDAIEQEYNIKDPRSVEYAAWFPIELDGAIQQVAYIVAESGKPSLRASRNREELDLVPSYKETRRVEQIKEQLRKEDQSARAKRINREKSGKVKF